ncbi:hypothetical protein WR25_24528 [Diploscapter pachys]|uniref:Uncharacterized protein n=1 Tax=Diploscapter pachys TaxID=2018661 RepID=A0A2A2M5R2_9BILA|nr:hypothetical protein WR25_24528 [Diploscapter pachys]
MRLQLGEALAQVILLDEHMQGLVDAFVDGEVDIVVLPGVGAALVIPVDLGLCREEGVGHDACVVLGSGLVSRW